MRDRSPTVHDMSLVVVRRIGCHRHCALVRVSLRDCPAKLRHMGSRMIRLATRSSCRCVVEVTRWKRWGGLVSWSRQLCHRSRSRRIRIQGGWRHWTAHIPRIRILSRWARSRIQTLGSRVGGEASPRSRLWWVRSRRLLRGHRRGPRIVGLISARGRTSSVPICRRRRRRWISIWYLTSWRWWRPLELRLRHLRRHGVGATLSELRGLGIHGLRAAWWRSTPEDIGICGISLHGRSRAIRPVIPVTLAPQVCHVSHRIRDRREMASPSSLNERFLPQGIRDEIRVVTRS